MTTSNPRTTAPPELPANVIVQSRIRALQSTLDSESDDRIKCSLEYEIGALTEHGLGEQAAAARRYLSAYNLAPDFRPPLFALARIFAGRRSFKNLERIYRAEVRAARNDRDKASALVDLAVVLGDHLQQPDEACDALEQALELDPTLGAAALMLEHRSLSNGLLASAAGAVELRAAQAVADPSLKAALLWEVARTREASGDVDTAIELLRSAAALPSERGRTLAHLERMARSHGRFVGLVEALEALAQHIFETARKQSPDDASGPDVAEASDNAGRALERSAALWAEAARLRAMRCDDPTGAVAAYEKALDILPQEPVLRHELMTACERAGDLEGVASHARILLQEGAEGPHAAPLHFRLAEFAHSQGEGEAARAALLDAAAADPESGAVVGVLEDSLLDGRQYDELVARIEARAEKATGEGKAQALWRAGRIAAAHLGDAEAARRLLESAAAVSQHPTPVWRDLYGQALHPKDWGTAETAAAALCGLELEDQELSVLLRERCQMRRMAGDSEAAHQLLQAALRTEACHQWAPDAARVWCALRKDHSLLAEAHRALALRCTDEPAKVAHLCAAARVLSRAGSEEEAIACLREALELAPAHAYAVSLLQELLMARGEAEQVVALLREAAGAQTAAHQSKVSLLRAGAAAEESGHFELAARSYEDAADRDPTALGPLWSLRRLGERTGDRAALRLALEGLAPREHGLGSPAMASLELGEHYDTVGKAELAVERLTGALEDESVGVGAAVSLLALSSGAAAAAAPGRDAALSLLAQNVSGDLALSLGRERVADRVAQDSEQARQLTSELLRDHPEDVWAHLVQILEADSRPARATAFVSLGHATRDPKAAADLLFHGLRAQMMQRGGEAADDAVVLALGIEEEAPESLPAAVAIDETLTAGDDADARADALQRRFAHAPVEVSAGARAALAGVLLAAGRYDEAARLAQELVDEDEDELCAWEVLRVAGRALQDWPAVLKACEKLAEHCDDFFKAVLLEEMGTVLTVYLQRDREAEQRLRAALSIDPSREAAFDLLHDLAAKHEDASTLLELIATRMKVVEDPTELADLLYEKSRLLRSSADRSSALQVLEQLLDLEPAHVGGLGLKAEIHSSLEQWQEAVEALQLLADADVKPEQARMARVGAATFLERRLGDRRAAYEELDKLVSAGLADAAIHRRMADLAVRGSDYESAVVALAMAAEASDGEERAAHELRAAKLYVEHLGDAGHAIGAYRGALIAVPTHYEACKALVDLVVDPVERRQIVHGFEQAVRAELEPKPVEQGLLRKLLDAATWLGERDMTYVVLNALCALRVATEHERKRYAELATTAPARPKGRLGDNALAALRAPGDSGTLARMGAVAAEALAATNRITAATYGVKRRDRVGRRDVNPVRDEVYALAATFGLELDEFYVGGDNGGRIAAIGQGGTSLAWVLGEDAKPPLSPRHRFEIGRQAMAARLGVLPLMAEASDVEAARRLFAAALAAGAPLPAAEDDADAQRLAQGIADYMPRKVRVELQEIAPSVPEGGGGVLAYVAAARQSCLRAGLFLSGDLDVALSAVLGERPRPQAVEASPLALDLLRFAISPSLLALRREMGLAL